MSMIIPNSSVDFWFFKVHFAPNLFVETAITAPLFADMLMDAVGNPIYEERNKAWRLGGLKRADIDGRNVLFGKIGRVSTNKMKVVYDEVSKDYVDTNEK